MAKVIDLTHGDGDLVIIGRALVLPSSQTDSQPHPLNGSLRFNPTLGVPQCFHAGTWFNLDGSGGGGDGSGAAGPPWTIAQITGLQNLLNAKAPTIHTHAMTDIIGLSAALANKSDITHTHSITQITGLRGELDGKAALVHSHNYTVKDAISGCFPASPPANYKLVYTAPFAIHIPVNGAGSQITLAANPAATYTMTLTKGTATGGSRSFADVGSIIFYPSGQITLNLPSGLDLAVGDTLTFQCPARDTAIDTISFSLAGTRDPQVTT